MLDVINEYIQCTQGVSVRIICCEDPVGPGLQDTKGPQDRDFGGASPPPYSP